MRDEDWRSKQGAQGRPTLIISQGAQTYELQGPSPQGKGDPGTVDTFWPNLLRFAAAELAEQPRECQARRAPCWA